mgnify:CR=1 FL=1|tara:strand:- start:288 stop:698 length:411 start_codon:yes stop_codon:yes gene_type:complete
MIVVHSEEGRIIQTLDGAVDPSVLTALDQQGVLYADIDFERDGNLHELFSRYYVADGRLTLRAAITPSVSTIEIRADGKDKAVIKGLPKPCTLMVDGHLVERKGGTITLTADVPATYRVAVEQWPLLPWSVEIVAT